MSTDPNDSWSIDELASLVKLPTRTIREYRTLGLISPPTMVGRVGRYDRAHRDRLELIARLQNRGYSLAAIADLCAASKSGRSLEEVLGGAVAVALDQPTARYTTAQLTAAVPAFADEAVLERAISVGLVRRFEQHWAVRAPALLTVVAEMLANGASPDGALAMAAGVIDGARAQAAALGDLVVAELLPAQTVPSAEFVAAARRVRLLLTQAVGSLFADAVGLELTERASRDGHDGLAVLVETIRVGTHS
jgi:DNA-binding transcriptional MerR regulator